MSCSLPVVYFFFRPKALSHCLVDRCMSNSRESYSGQAGRVKPSADVPSLSRCDPMENRKHTLTFLLRPAESGRKCSNSTCFPVVSCLIIAKVGLHPISECCLLDELSRSYPDGSKSITQRFEQRRQRRWLIKTNMGNEDA